MPNYGIPQAGSQLPPNQGLNLTTLQPGDSMVLFSAEAPAAPQASVAFATGYEPGGQSPQIAFTIKTAAAAPTCSIVIQGSNTDVDGDYQTLYTSTNKQFDYYADLGGFLFYRAKLVSGAVTLTVIAQR